MSPTEFAKLFKIDPDAKQKPWTEPEKAALCALFLLAPADRPSIYYIRLARTLKALRGRHALEWMVLHFLSQPKSKRAKERVQVLGRKLRCGGEAF